MQFYSLLLGVARRSKETVSYNYNNLYLNPTLFFSFFLKLKSSLFCSVRISILFVCVQISKLIRKDKNSKDSHKNQ